MFTRALHWSARSIQIHNTIGRTTHHHGIHKCIEGTTYKLLKLQNGNTAIFIKNVKSLMMTKIS
jgi:hypothetical protein